MKKTVRDMALNLIFILIGIVLALLIPSQVPGIKQSVQMGPDFFPYIAAALMVAVNTISLVKNFFCYGKEKANSMQSVVEKFNPKDQIRVLLILAIIVVYVVFMPVVGYVISTLAVVNILLLVLGARKWYQYLLVSGFAMVVFFVFKYLLYVMLP